MTPGDPLMKTFVHAIWLSCALAFAGPSALAQLPQRNLTVELRQVEDAAAGYGVGTRPQTPLLAPQQLQVRNGDKARWRFGQAIPLQWVQSVSAAGPMSGASVRQGLTWLQAGQGLVVQPRWPGGNRPVQVQIEVQTAAVEARAGSELPVQASGEIVTTLEVPLGAWVTFASSGAVAPRGSYSSEAGPQVRRLMQLRVSVP